MPVMIWMAWIIQKLAKIMIKPIIAPVRACLPSAAFSALPPLLTTLKPAKTMIKRRMTLLMMRMLGRMTEMMAPRLGKASATVRLLFNIKLFSRLTPPKAGINRVRLVLVESFIDTYILQQRTRIDPEPGKVIIWR